MKPFLSSKERPQDFQYSERPTSGSRFHRPAPASSWRRLSGGCPTSWLVPRSGLWLCHGSAEAGNILPHPLRSRGWEGPMYPPLIRHL
jgi:hypothetical protein